MAERLIHIVAPADWADRVREIIRRADGVESWHDSAAETRSFTVHVPADRVDGVLDPIQAALGETEGFRAFVLPLEAALPRPPEPAEDSAAEPTDPPPAAAPPSRISREELHTDLSELADVTRVFLALVVLSTIVAAVGLSRNNPTIVIGAMVIAPLLGPNMALSLATTLGDAKLALRALRSTVTGVVVAALVAAACGLVLDVDPTAGEIASRTFVGPSDLALALAAGVAGALAFTTGAPASLIGVMVAVALLPPLVVCAMLLTQGRFADSLGALLLLGCNVISINLAGVATFLVQGVTPRRWWDAERSKRMTYRVLAIWVALLVTVAILITLSNLSHGG